MSGWREGRRLPGRRAAATAGVVRHLVADVDARDGANSAAVAADAGVVGRPQDDGIAFGVAARRHDRVFERVPAAK